MKFALLLLLTASPVELQVRETCRTENTRTTGLDARGFEACVTRRLPLAQRRAAEQEAEAATANAEQARRDAAQAELRRQLDGAQAEEQRADDARRKRCGRDYMRVRVGMRFARVQDCAGPLRVRYADGAAKVYEGAGGVVRVEAGRVTRVVYR